MPARGIRQQQRADGGLGNVESADFNARFTQQPIVQIC